MLCSGKDRCFYERLGSNNNDATGSHGYSRDNLARIGARDDVGNDNRHKARGLIVQRLKMKLRDEFLSAQVVAGKRLEPESITSRPLRSRGNRGQFWKTKRGGKIG